MEVATVILELCRRDTGVTVPIEVSAPRKFEVRESYYRIDKAREVLGFAPSVDFKKGVERTWRWFLENVNPHEVGSGSSA